MADPMRKEVSVVRKKIDSVNKELKPLGSTVQKKVTFYITSVHHEYKSICISKLYELLYTHTDQRIDLYGNQLNP